VFQINGAAPRLAGRLDITTIPRVQSGQFLILVFSLNSIDALGRKAGSLATTRELLSGEDAAGENARILRVAFSNHGDESHLSSSTQCQVALQRARVNTGAISLQVKGLQRLTDFQRLKNREELLRGLVNAAMNA